MKMSVFRKLLSTNEFKKQFIENAQNKYKDQFDYSQVNYKNSQTNVTIICKKHGSFQQRPSNHLTWTGCPGCKSEIVSARKRTPEEDFIKDCKDMYGEEYDYSDLNYAGINSTVNIRCRKHGLFSCMAMSHLRGTVCPTCKQEQKRKNLVQKLKNVHFENYTYDSVKLSDAYTIITVTCKTHGDFDIRAHDHLKGLGCSKCDLEKRTSNFLTKAAMVHDSKYNYSKVDYVNAMTKVVITCPTHGDFEQPPYGHLAGYGCFACGVIMRRMDKERFVKQAKVLHKNHYRYDDVEYLDRYTKVSITCPIHGNFLQTPEIHLKGCGCRTCTSSVGELTIKEVLDKHEIKYIAEYSIPKNRYRYDFYLPDYNLLIEFHGIQHYKFVEYFHKSEEEFKIRKIVDDAKMELAKSWGINLIVLNYEHLELPSEVFEELLIRSIVRP